MQIPRTYRINELLPDSKRQISEFDISAILPSNRIIVKGFINSSLDIEFEYKFINLNSQIESITIVVDDKYKDTAKNIGGVAILNTFALDGIQRSLFHISIKFIANFTKKNPTINAKDTKEMKLYVSYLKLRDEYFTLIDNLQTIGIDKFCIYYTPSTSEYQIFTNDIKNSLDVLNTSYRLNIQDTKFDYYPCDAKHAIIPMISVNMKEQLKYSKTGIKYYTTIKDHSNGDKATVDEIKESYFVIIKNLIKNKDQKLTYNRKLNDILRKNASYFDDDNSYNKLKKTTEEKRNKKRSSKKGKSFAKRKIAKAKINPGPQKHHSIDLHSIGLQNNTLKRKRRDNLSMTDEAKKAYINEMEKNETEITDTEINKAKNIIINQSSKISVKYLSDKQRYNESPRLHMNTRSIGIQTDITIENTPVITPMAELHNLADSIDNLINGRNKIKK